MSLTDRLAKPDLSEDRVIARNLPLIFGGTIFVSAFLLFGVQPMFTKMVLPALGGSPAVWSVAMVFFQALLLIGYLYAHVSSRFLTPAQSLAVHALLIVAAMAVLPLSVSQAFGAPPEEGQALWVIAVFAVSVGLPFFVLSATAPLLQSWFARSGHARASNPYFLYVASNLGSFLALLSYPLGIEPLLPLKLQSWSWAVAFAVLGLGLVACGFLSMGRPGSVAEVKDHAGEVPCVTWRERVIWIGLAAIPSGLLVAVTAHLSTDVASAPLLWVLPLAIFMLTFVLAFRNHALLGEGRAEWWFTKAAAFIIVSLAGFALPLGVQFLIHFGGLFLAAMICHAALYRRRPDVGQLTEFYLWMSFGGMLGGLFTGLLAPLLFNTIVEYRLLLIAALLCLPMTAATQSWRKQLTFAGVALLIGLAVIGAVPFLTSLGPGVLRYSTVAIAAGFLAVIIFNRAGPIASAASAAAAFMVLSPAASSTNIAAVRSFFGVNYVRVSPGGDARLLVHGSTVHGAFRFADLDGKPMAGRPQPTTYYHDGGGINVALVAAREFAGGKLNNVAVLGLGAGAMACQSAPGETWAYFEIDREVVTLATRPDLFPFVPSCTPGARIVIGDARLTLQKEQKKFDVIILDAFSSDAVPAHLLTREAFGIYHSMLAPGGTVIAHVSNRYMDIRSVTEAASLGQNLAVVSGLLKPDLSIPKSQLQLATSTTVVVMSKNDAVVEKLAAQDDWRKPDPAVSQHLWTDDYANIIGAIYRQWRKTQ